MRTVTFADSQVVDLLNEKFVVAWNNHGPEGSVRGEQARYTPAEIAAYPEGGGGNNLHTVISSSEGSVLSVLTGFWSADVLLKELDFSLSLSKEHAQAQHKDRMVQLSGEVEALERSHPEERNKRVKDSPVLRRKAALQLLMACHRLDSSQGPRVIEEVLAEFFRNSRTRVFK